MVQIVAATFKDGVFKPDKPPGLLDSSRVRLVIEPIEENETARRNEAWATLQQLWKTSRLNSGGNRLSREQLHERR